MKPSDLKKRLKEIDQAAKRGWNSYCVELAGRLVSDFPEQAAAWFELGWAAYGVARYSDALSAFRRGLRLTHPSKRYLVHAQLGHIFRESGQFRRAEACYRKALAGDRQAATWHIFLGALLAVTGRLTEAEAVHREATRCPKGCIDEAYLNLGLVLRAQRRYKEARSSFQKALKITPTYKEARRHLDDMEHVLLLARQRHPPGDPLAHRTVARKARL